MGGCVKHRAAKPFTKVKTGSISVHEVQPQTSPVQIQYSTTPLSRTLKGPKKMVRLNVSLTYPNFTLSQTK